MSTIAPRRIPAQCIPIELAVQAAAIDPDAALDLVQVCQFDAQMAYIDVEHPRSKEIMRANESEDADTLPVILTEIHAYYAPRLDAPGRELDAWDRLLGALRPDPEPRSDFTRGWDTNSDVPF